MSVVSFFTLTFFEIDRIPQFNVSGSNKHIDVSKPISYVQYFAALPITKSKCGIHNPNRLVIPGNQGKIADEGEWPHVCLLSTTTNNARNPYHFAGASLLTPKILLTTAESVL